jgi:signal transduction histidine kinase
MTNFNPRHPNCLLVDDLEENLIALSAVLKNEEINIFTARSGSDALELMLKHEFAVALIDVQMPEMDGFELAEIMRSTEKTRHIPIIFVTAAGSNMQRMFRGYEAGAVDFLHKPLASQVVIGKIKVFVELYMHKMELEEKIQKLKETEQFLQRALKSRDDFMSIASHELKTPLTSLKMQLQLLERQRYKAGDEHAMSSDKMDKFLGQADRSVERIIHLVNDMLDISRMATGKLTFQIEKASISELVREVCDRMLPLMELVGCKLEVNIESEIYCQMDRFRIEQVITNLLTNAAKYAPECPVFLEVKKQGDYMVAVTVRDLGPGIN